VNWLSQIVWHWWRNKGRLSKRASYLERCRGVWLAPMLPSSSSIIFEGAKPHGLVIQKFRYRSHLVAVCQLLRFLIKSLLFEIFFIISISIGPKLASKQSILLSLRENRAISNIWDVLLCIYENIWQLWVVALSLLQLKLLFLSLLHIPVIRNKNILIVCL
jgi:hypothetical protein